MLIEAVVRLDDRGRTTFGGDGVAAHGVDLRDDCDVQAGVGLDCGDRGTQTGRAAADHDDVMLGNLVHLVCCPIRPVPFILPRRRGGPAWSSWPDRESRRAALRSATIARGRRRGWSGR